VKIHKRDGADHNYTLCGRPIPSYSGQINRDGQRIVWAENESSVNCRQCARKFLLRAGRPLVGAAARYAAENGRS
jgi:hypothetical protein